MLLLQASGAGDGVIRLWQVAEGKHGKTLEPLGGLPASRHGAGAQAGQMGQGQNCKERHSAAQT